MHLDGGLQPAVMGELDVGIASPDMREHHAVPAPELAEQLVGIVGVGCLIDDIDDVSDLRVTGAMDRLALVAEVYVAIAADRGVGRPFIARDADEPPRVVEFRRELIELPPECAGDLEIIGLMAHDVEMRLVAAVLEIFARRVGAERLVRLAVGVAPEAQQGFVARRDAQRIGAAELGAVLVQHANRDIARRSRCASPR